MNILSIPDWCRWGLNGLDSYVFAAVDKMGEDLNPPKVSQCPAPAVSLQPQDVYEAPPRTRDAARIATLRAEKLEVDAQRQKHQRAYRTAELLLGVSGLAAAMGVALLSSPFTIPLGLVLFGGGSFGMLSFYPTRAESKDASDKLEICAAVLEGQLKEAER